MMIYIFENCNTARLVYLCITVFAFCMVGLNVFGSSVILFVCTSVLDNNALYTIFHNFNGGLSIKEQHLQDRDR